MKTISIFQYDKIKIVRYALSLINENDTTWKGKKMPTYYRYVFRLS